MELGEHVFAGDAGGPGERHERDVVLLLPRGAGEHAKRVEQAVDELVARPQPAHERAHAAETEHRVARVVRLGETVGVEEDDVAGTEHCFLLLVTHARHRAERHACRA